MIKYTTNENGKVISIQVPKSIVEKGIELSDFPIDMPDREKYFDSMSKNNEKLKALRK